MHHTDLINQLIKENDYNKYLEIGVQNPANNFDKIDCQVKYGIDPFLLGSPTLFEGTSDEYFATYNELYDIIFIDGLHHEDQVKRDFENALKCLTKNGTILIHDCYPTHISTTIVPRCSKVWHGDVYKFVMNLRSYSGISYKTYTDDHGICVIKRSNYQSMFTYNKNMNWSRYLENREVYLNVVK